VKTYADTLKDQVRAARVTLSVATAAAKPSEPVQDAVVSAEERSAIANDLELAALRRKMIDGIFELQGKPETPVRRQLREFGYVIWWLTCVVVLSFVLAIATTFPYFVYECATTTARTCSDLDVPAFEPLMVISIIAGIVLATWGAMHGRNQWRAYVNRVHNMPIGDLLKEWKHQADFEGHAPRSSAALRRDGLPRGKDRRGDEDRVMASGLVDT
jgi:hypothetical protein